MKVAPAITAQATARGAMSRPNEMPAALIAISSPFSASWPMIMVEASRVASGRASGRARLHTPQNRNSRMVRMPRPFPTSSSMYSHRVCIIRMKTTIIRIATNGPMNAFRTKRSSLFIPVGAYVIGAWRWKQAAPGHP